MHLVMFNYSLLFRASAVGQKSLSSLSGALESEREGEGDEQQRRASKHAHLDFLIPLMQTECGADIAGP